MAPQEIYFPPLAFILIMLAVMLLVLAVVVFGLLWRNGKTTSVIVSVGAIFGLIMAGFFLTSPQPSSVTIEEDVLFPPDNALPPGVSEGITLEGDTDRILPPTTRENAPAAEVVEPAADRPAGEVVTAEPNSAPLKPAWIDESIESSDGIHRVHIETLPFEDANRCRDELEMRIVAEAQSYSEKTFGYGQIEPSADYLGKKIEASEAAGNYYLEKTEYHYGTLNPETRVMHTAHLLLEFNQQKDLSYFEKLSRRAMAKYRVYYASAGLAAVLVLLTTLYGYLRLDQVTAGRARGRLRMAAVGVIVALAGGGAIFVSLVPMI